ncbi:hypothetical protein [Paenibacillus glacialis]|uniref:hypothetical protein n=1 Tax=Paenibacillus glacialis TaxID=494026 RepID=UPI000A6C30ED|nr:hypothetical protein [Paenibacillus glacialis]
MLESRAKELEYLVSNEQENEGSLNAFQQEIKKFVQLELGNEEMLREVLNRLIERVEIAKDGSIDIHYNFKNPLLLRA